MFIAKTYLVIAKSYRSSAHIMFEPGTGRCPPDAKSGRNGATTTPNSSIQPARSAHCSKSIQSLSLQMVVLFRSNEMIFTLFSDTDTVQLPVIITYKIFIHPFVRSIDLFLSFVLFVLFVHSSCCQATNQFLLYFCGSLLRYFVSLFFSFVRSLNSSV